MFLQGSTKIRSLCSKIPASAKDSLGTNSGALYLVAARGMSSSETGSGAGKGGGSGGSIREAGGSMGKRAAASEEQYFRKESQALKDKLKGHLHDEIKKHEEAIKATKQLVQELEKDK